MKIALVALACLYAAINLVVSKVMSAREMKAVYIDGQCTIGKIAANLFYAPAWFLKGVKIAVWFLVK